MTDAYDPYAPRQIGRDKRQAKRTVEAMADTVELSAEMAELGMISPEAHEETVAIAAAISEKFGGKAEPEPGTNAVAGKELRQFIEQIEFMQGEIDEINKDKSDKYREIKGRGYDPKIVKRIIQMRRIDKAQRLEEEAVLQTYMAALGME